MVFRLLGLLAAGLIGSALSFGFLSTAVAQSTATTSGNVEAEAGQVTATEADTLANLKKTFEARFEGIEVAGVKATPFKGLYEVQLGLDVLYTNATVDYLLQGSLIDAKTREDLTAERLQQLAQVPLASLPLHLAIKQVKGNGERQMAVFEDPNCGYCKMLHKTLEQVDNVTVYTLLMPILSPDSKMKARNIWCAKDKVAAWREWMLNGKIPPEAVCDAPLDEVLALGKKLMVRGTPAIIFSDGSRVGGALPLDALNKKLASVK